jgi:hypothetical protein
VSKRTFALFPLLLLLTVGPASAAAAKPVLRVTGNGPVTVRGSAFHAREHVTLKLVTNDVQRVRRVTTSLKGTFTTSFVLAVPVDPCTGGLTVRASGDQGDSATVKIVPRECPPAG